MFKHINFITRYACIISFENGNLALMRLGPFVLVRSPVSCKLEFRAFKTKLCSFGKPRETWL